MFDFKKLIVYQKSKVFNALIRALILESKFDSTTTNQLRRASLSIVLNIAEGTGRFSNRDRRNFYVISRSSIFECVAILDVLLDDRLVTKDQCDLLLSQAEELSKMLYAMIKNLE